MEETMSTRRFSIERVSITSHKPLQDALSKFDAAVGCPNIEQFWKLMTAAKTTSEMEKLVQSALGPSGFMEFARFDHGGVVHKGKPAGSPGVVRLVIGNPLIMREMVKHVPFRVLGLSRRTASRNQRMGNHAVNRPLRHVERDQASDTHRSWQ
jgi:hypothetical protein